MKKLIAAGFDRTGCFDVFGYNFWTTTTSFRTDFFQVPALFVVFPVFFFTCQEIRD